MGVRIRGPIYCLLGKHYNIWYVLNLGLNFLNLKMSTKNVNYQLLIGSINRLVSEFIIKHELVTKCGKM